MREAVLKLTMDYKMTKHMLNNGTLNGSRTWLLVRTWHCYFISFNSEHPVSSGPLPNLRQRNPKDSVISPMSAMSQWPRMTTGDKFQRHSFKLSFKLKVKSVRGRLFYIWHFWKINELLVRAHMRTSASEPEPEPPEPVHFARSQGRSRSRRKVLLGAGARAGIGTYFPGAGAGVGADKKCHGSASLL